MLESLLAGAKDLAMLIDGIGPPPGAVGRRDDAVCRAVRAALRFGGFCAMTGSTNANVPKILLVDAHEDTRLITRACLEHNGFRVETAHDGGAVRSFVGWADVVVMGLRIPTVDDGIELLRAICALRDAPPMIVVTADDTRRDQAIAAGAAAFLVKPVATGDLLRAIFVALGMSYAPHPPT